MRLPQRHGPASVGINMTPMIDVVFQLIIFFLVSSHLAKQEAQLPLPLPVADSSAAPQPTPARHVVVNVLNDGTLLLAGRRLGAAVPCPMRRLPPPRDRRRRCATARSSECPSSSRRSISRL